MGFAEYPPKERLANTVGLSTRALGHLPNRAYRAGSSFPGRPLGEAGAALWAALILGCLQDGGPGFGRRGSRTRTHGMRIGRVEPESEQVPVHQER